MLLQIGALIILTCIAADISRRVHLNRSVFAEFGQPTSIDWLVWLYPVPFILPLISKPLALLIFRVPMGMLVYIPAVMSAWTSRKRFELSGDGRVKPALAAVELASTAGIMGMMGVVLISLLAWLFGMAKP